MDILRYLKDAGALLGPSGHEAAAAEWFKRQFEPLSDKVEIDPLFNVLATQKPTLPMKSGKPPRVLLCAHQDEIALMAAAINDDGTLRLGQVGGVDPRILPAGIVTVHATGGAKPRELQGVVGALPPHLLSAEKRSQNYERDALFVDLGLPAAKVRKLVQVGDLITLNGAAVGLLNGRAAGKTMDDRACIGVLLEAAERLKTIGHKAEIIYGCTTQEEVGSRGARVAAQSLAPDLAVILDVTHATIPASRPDTSIPLDAAGISAGPYLQPKLTQRLMDTAKALGVKYNPEYLPRYTGTDADDVQITREGVPCVLIDVPLKYMHTSVELLDTNVIRECGRLLAGFLSELSEGWDESLWI